MKLGPEREMIGGLGIWRVAVPFVARTGRVQMTAELERLKALPEGQRP